MTLRCESCALRWCGLKYGWAQIWMGSNMVRAVFWQRTDLPPGSNMLRLAYADSGSACKLAGVQISLLPTLANQILARTFFRSVANLFACPAVGKFSRASSAGGRRRLQKKLASRIVSVAEDCLSPERTFHGCSLMQFRRTTPSLDSDRYTPLHFNIQ